MKIYKPPTSYEQALDALSRMCFDIMCEASGGKKTLQVTKKEDIKFE